MKDASTQFDVIILGAGAAGLFCAGEAARQGMRVAVLDHAEKIGEKIRISGGGRCNFTNIRTAPENFISNNSKFCISALKGFSAQDFLARIDAAGIPWHEKHLGQLFCDRRAQDIIDLLVDGCHEAHVRLITGTAIDRVDRTTDGFEVSTHSKIFTARNLVIATGGKSIPKIGATGFGYQLATQFGLNVISPRPALVPLTFEGDVKDMARTLAGVSVDAKVSAPPISKKRTPSFHDGFLFTHRGLSGPSILQISSYWREGQSLSIDLHPASDLYTALRAQRAQNGRIAFQTALAAQLPGRLAEHFCSGQNWKGNLADWSDKRLRDASNLLHHWRVTPVGSEGYRTAEVTLGGVDTEALNSKTMEVKTAPGLFFIGEVVDVTGWLGGYNFQWAWSSAYAAARAIANRTAA
ncbi:MAG: NAD(P)/FAD-dependent oxidoreductase [Parvularculaceae bacterium]|nr:MAG: NAD(P)/FAD-dependent oxidoreductase [Parvularculaceae bacterium]